MTPQDVYVEGNATAISKWGGYAQAAKDKLGKLVTGEVA